MKHVVMFSGGVGSWAAAKRVAAQHGTADLILLFADTLMEDADLYRFLREASADVGGEFVWLAEGRDPWRVFNDVRFLGNTRIDPCSRILKRDICRRWITDNMEPDNTVIYIGFDWTEEHRLGRAQGYWGQWTLAAPMTEPPLLDKDQVLALLQGQGIKPPRLYALGFPHNNCGGFCIKAGQTHFKLLLEKLPERYAYHERQEQAFRKRLGKNVAILRDRRGGVTRPLTLCELRQRIESGESIDKFDWGGCGCFVE